MDVLEEIGEWKLYEKQKVVKFNAEKDLKRWLTSRATIGSQVCNVYFSGNKDRI